ncbi:DNA translocase FtsK [Desulfosporosinus sp. Sb-LF]|nr:DNA translocase FtsK [Desulfosporosinus sp. Sb-LF]
MGKSLAWVGLLLGLFLAFLLWFYSTDLTSIVFESSGKPSSRENSRPRNRRKKQPNQKSLDEMKKSNFRDDSVSNVFPLPEGKLVNLHGFNQYFTTPEWVEMKDTDVRKIEEMEELGKNFTSYFATGESIFPKKLRKMTTLKGLQDYMEEVDKEERLERVPQSQEGVRRTEISKISLEKPTLVSSVFKSQSDQDEFLAQFKVDGNPLDQDMLDLVGDLRKDTRTIDEAEKIAQVVEGSVSKNGLEEKIISILMPEIKKETILEMNSEIISDIISELNSSVELMNEPELANLKNEQLETACTSLELQESEIPEVVATAPKPNYAGQVAQLVDQIKKEQPEDHWKFPGFDLLDSEVQHLVVQDTETPKLLEKVLLDFGVKAKVIRVTSGPVITRYELAPAPGVKISKIVNLSDDIALGLAARDVRIEAPIPGKAAIGIEVPNKHARSVRFREVLETTSFGKYASKLKVALGKDIADQPIIADLIKMPHLLVAGATGSGKSVCITTIINSILYNATPDEVKFLLVDPKMVELSHYNGIPHLLAPVVVDPKKAASALKWIVKEMENRYELFAAAGVRDIERYNKFKAVEITGDKPALPFIVVVIDELADLMMVAAGEVEEAICRLAQMARAAGIHLVIATQRPSVDIITGVIKANIPSRISFAVSSQIDSRTILDATGAEKLLGRGDMLYSPLGVNKALRVQGCLVTDEEVQRVITHWKGLGRPDYLDPERLFAETTDKNEETNGLDDALFIDAGQLFIRTGMASVSFLQRRLKLGYTRAARLMDMLEGQGVVGAYEGSKPRQVLLTSEEFKERFE